MCGISGIWNHDQKPVDPELLSSFTDRMKHRGPNARGTYQQGDVGLGHRRLSIIDIDGSAQPMTNAAGLTIVFNGEIYNFRELKQVLRKKGHCFQTNGDTEVILQAYSEWGPDCLNHLRGMFAFAIWDSNKRELFLARDRFGIKPLCIASLSNGLAFASEIEAFHALAPDFDKAVSPEALDKYLYYGYIPAPYSIFRSVQKLPPAHWCLIKNPKQHLHFHKYWEIKFNSDFQNVSLDWQEGLTEAINKSVESHLIADVPIGAFLSGGIDSSSVVAAMCQCAPETVNAYTIGFTHSAYDERPITRESARILPVRYHEEELQIDVLATLELLVQRYGEPFADSSAVCTYSVAETAARDVTVMLSGDGGDEVFCGYSHYAWMLSEFSRSFNKLQRMRTFAGDALRSFGARPPRMTLLQAWTGRNAYFNLQERQNLWNSDYKHVSQATETYLRERFSSLKTVSRNSFVDTLQKLDICDYLAGNNLHKVDIASMCHGLEVRVPLLDHELVEYAVKIPWHERIRGINGAEGNRGAMHGYVGKLPLRWYAEKTFGHGYFDRKKMGFAMPIDEWLASKSYRSILHECLLDRSNPLTSYFSDQSLRALVCEHQERKNKGLQLWSLLFLSRWLSHIGA